MKYFFIGLLSLFAVHLNGQKMHEFQQVITTLFVASDQHDWPTVIRCFDERVTLDYSSMTAQAPAELSGEEIAQNWQSILPAFKHTQHQLGNFLIEEEGRDKATVSCYGTATHYLDKLDKAVWTVVGSYEFELLKRKKQWKISKMKFNFKYQDGNLELPEIALNRLKGSTTSTVGGAKDNINSARAFFQALEEENLAQLADLFAENARQVNPYHSDIFPKGAEGREGIKQYWSAVFPNFDGMRFPIEEIYAMQDSSVVLVKYRGVIQLKNSTAVYENDYYSIFKFNALGEIVEHQEIFNPIVAARGFGLVDKINKKNTIMKKVKFKSEGLDVVGNLYYPSDYQVGEKYPAIVVSGSWTTVKEQMAGLYAKKLAEQGFICLAFDFRNFGESEGEPRFYESPKLKKEDIENAVSYLAALAEVDDSKIAAYGVCAGAMYTLMAAAEDDRIKAVVTAASWLHDEEAVKLFYGGEEGVQEKISAAQNAKHNYAQNGVVEYIPTISTEDPTAAMYGPYDYYLNPERGAIEAWSDDKFAVMSWEDWLKANPMLSAKNINCPTLMIHSDGAVLPEYTKKYFSEIATTDKKLHWIDTDLQSPFHQFKFYDQKEEVEETVEQAAFWFREKL